MNSGPCPAPAARANPLVIIISGPSGVGKDAVLHEIKQRRGHFEFITTVTTRQQRPNETDRVDYHFISEAEFQDLLKRSEFLEHANVYGHRYGVPKGPVREALAAGRDTIIKVDVQGAANIKKILPEAVFIFIAPPNLDDLSDRLKKRRTESEFDLALRLKTAGQEMQQIERFDYVVCNPNDRLDLAVDQIEAIVTAERCRTNPRQIAL
jgi:guanylate kinase